MPSRQHKAPARNHLAVEVDDNGKNEAELIQTRCELVELAARVPAGLSTERLQFFSADKDGGQVTGNSVAVLV